MNEEKVQAILNNPKFVAMVKRRNSFAFWLSAAMLVIYFGFILIVAFAKSFLAAPIGGGLMTVGMPLGVLVILSAFGLTGVYVNKANTEFDDITREVLEELK